MCLRATRGRTMTGTALIAKILLIENDAATAEKIREALATSTAGTFELEWVHELSEGLGRLHDNKIAAILLDLNLPDSTGMDTFDQVFRVAQDIPILSLDALRTKKQGEKPWGAARRTTCRQPTWITFHCRACYAARSNARPSTMRYVRKKNAP